MFDMKIIDFPYLHPFQRDTWKPKTHGWWEKIYPWWFLYLVWFPIHFTCRGIFWLKPPVLGLQMYRVSIFSSAFPPASPPKGVLLSLASIDSRGAGSCLGRQLWWTSDHRVRSNSNSNGSNGHSKWRKLWRYHGKTYGIWHIWDEYASIWLGNSENIPIFAEIHSIHSVFFETCQVMKKNGISLLLYFPYWKWSSGFNLRMFHAYLW